jgi:hypothetical protein
MSRRAVIRAAAQDGLIEVLAAEQAGFETDDGIVYAALAYGQRGVIDWLRAEGRLDDRHPLLQQVDLADRCVDGVAVDALEDLGRRFAAERRPCSAEWTATIPRTVNDISWHAIDGPSSPELLSDFRPTDPRCRLWLWLNDLIRPLTPGTIIMPRASTATIIRVGISYDGPDRPPYTYRATAWETGLELLPDTTYRGGLVGHIYGLAGFPFNEPTPVDVELPSGEAAPVPYDRPLDETVHAANRDIRELAAAIAENLARQREAALVDSLGH